MSSGTSAPATLSAGRFVSASKTNPAQVAAAAAGVAAAATIQSGTSESAYGVRTTPVISARIKAAMDHGARYDGGAVAGGDKAADDDGDMGLDGDGLEDGVERCTLADDDDADMDGKPLSDSRSRPEVATPSHSLEFNNVDTRNNSLDSYLDKGSMGLSTLPNQYCSLLEAQELKKFILASKGKSGLIPSSSAVMDMYMVGKVVGVGSYGKVRAAWHRLTSMKVAIKTYDKAKVKDPSHWKRVQSEIKIMEQVSHPRIARLYEAVETPKRMHLIMECLDGGNLCSYVKAKRRLSEDESRRIFFQLMQGMEYLHGLGFIHRDIKLENVLFGDTKDIKLIDFGFSTVFQPGKRLRVFCGTPSYMAPEIVRRAEYDGKPVDMWSLGILLYALLCGCFPFRAKSYPDLYRRIARGYFTMPEELSPAVKDLLRQLLCVDAAARISAPNAIRHPWLQQQVACCPDMLKMKTDMLILIAERPSEDLDDQTLSELEKFGVTKDDIVKHVMAKIHAPLTTLYYLLRCKVMTQRRALALSNAQASSSAHGSKRPVPIPVPSNRGNGPFKQDNIPPQLLQGVLGSRPRSASAGRPGVSNTNRPSSAAGYRR